MDTKSIRLLTPQEEVARNIPVEQLAAFTKQIQESVARSVPPDAPGFELLVKVVLSSTKKPSLDLSSKGQAPESLLQKIYDDLQRLPDQRTKSDAVPFEVYFEVKAEP